MGIVAGRNSATRSRSSWKPKAGNLGLRAARARRPSHASQRDPRLARHLCMSRKSTGIGCCPGACGRLLTTSRCRPGREAGSRLRRAAQRHRLRPRRAASVSERLRNASGRTDPLATTDRPVHGGPRHLPSNLNRCRVRASGAACYARADHRSARTSAPIRLVRCACHPPASTLRAGQAAAVLERPPRRLAARTKSMAATTPASRAAIRSIADTIRCRQGETIERAVCRPALGQMEKGCNSTCVPCRALGTRPAPTRRRGGIIWLRAGLRTHRRGERGRRGRVQKRAAPESAAQGKPPKPVSI